MLAKGKRSEARPGRREQAGTGGGSAGEQEAAPGRPKGPEAGAAGVRSRSTVAIGQLRQGDDDEFVREVEGLEVVLQLVHDQAEVVSGQSHQGVTGHLRLHVALRLSRPERGMGATTRWAVIRTLSPHACSSPAGLPWVQPVFAPRGNWTGPWASLAVPTNTHAQGWQWAETPMEPRALLPPGSPSCPWRRWPPASGHTAPPAPPPAG